AFSMEPEEMTLLMVESERAWQALGEGKHGPTDTEKKSFRRSLYMAYDRKAGKVLTTENVRAIRPG
ncbi:MAG: pseudaminic acid synthase, partial [Bacteroidia bacterium]|nr:pseudaminic acid synthase [Bacteroidia bacterium]